MFLSIALVITMSFSWITQAHCTADALSVSDFKNLHDLQALEIQIEALARKYSDFNTGKTTKNPLSVGEAQSILAFERLSSLSRDEAAQFVENELVRLWWEANFLRRQLAAREILPANSPLFPLLVEAFLVVDPADISTPEALELVHYIQLKQKIRELSRSRSFDQNEMDLLEKSRSEQETMETLAVVKTYLENQTNEPGPLKRDRYRRGEEEGLYCCKFGCANCPFSVGLRKLHQDNKKGTKTPAPDRSTKPDYFIYEAAQLIESYR